MRADDNWMKELECDYLILAMTFIVVIALVTPKLQ